MSWNCASASGSVAVPFVLRGVLMMSSLTSGFAMRETCTRGPDSTFPSSRPGSSTVTFWRVVLAYMPITGLRWSSRPARRRP